MEKIESCVDYIEVAKMLTNEHLEFIQVDLICTRAAVQELLSIVKYTIVENRQSFGSKKEGIPQRQCFTTPT